MADKQGTPSTPETRDELRRQEPPSVEFDELEVEELESVAGGVTEENTHCTVIINEGC